jgi:hypothetical protein
MGQAPLCCCNSGSVRVSLSSQIAQTAIVGLGKGDCLTWRAKAALPLFALRDIQLLRGRRRFPHYDSRATPCPLTPVEARLDDIFTRFEVELSQKSFVLLADNSTVEVALRRGKAKDLAFDLAVDTDSHLCSCSRPSVMGGFFTAFGRRRREGSLSLVDGENGISRWSSQSECC